MRNYEKNNCSTINIKRKKFTKEKSEKFSQEMQLKEKRLKYLTKLSILIIILNLVLMIYNINLKKLSISSNITINNPTGEPKNEQPSFISSYTAKDMINIENYEIHVLKELNKKKFYNQMSFKDRGFLNGIIRKLKPKKVLEIGVAGGGSSLIILNALKDVYGSFLYSSDIAEKFYEDNSKLTGYEVLNNYPEFKNKWKLYTGNIVGKFIEEIGKDIDVALIDTNHVAPGEMLDVLMILPFLKENATLIFHDINLNHMGWRGNRACSPTNKRCSSSYTNNLLINYLRGDIYFPKYENNKLTSVNIGAIKLAPNQKQFYYQYIYILSIFWDYYPMEVDIQISRKIIEKYYDKKCLEIFDMVVLSNKEYINRVGDNNYYKGKNIKLY